MFMGVRRCPSLKFLAISGLFFTITVYLLENKYDIFFKTKQFIGEINLPDLFQSRSIFGLNGQSKDAMFISAIAKYAKTLPKRHANETELKLIILAMTDNAFFDMAHNLYLTSFKKFGITNFLFVGAGKTACINLLQLNIQCFYFTEDSNTNQSNIFGTLQFVKKMNIRTDMIIKVLKANFSVLHTDLDVVFLDNPMPNIEEALRSSNMAILWDFSLYNAGFLVIKPTKFSIELYMDMQLNTNKSASLDDQSALNNAIKSLQTKYKADPVFSSVGILDKSKFLCGKCYYEVVDRNFPTKNGSNNCPGCLVVHDNWIVTMEAKVYRFKESLMWVIDRDKYYSDESRKYLLYNNPFLSNPPVNYTTDGAELSALKTGFAMAQMLNRTLIIPRLHCHGPKNPYECSFLHWIYIRTLDMQFKYRENSFLSNPLVPESIRKNLSSQCPYGTKENNVIQANACSPKLKNFTTGCLEPIWNLIDTQGSIEFNNLIRDSFDRVVMINFKNYSKIPEREILKRFDTCDDQVLYVASLLGVEVVFDNATVNEEFTKKVQKGILRKGYLQY